MPEAQEASVLKTAAESHAEIQKLLRNEINSLKSHLDARLKEISALTEQMETVETQTEAVLVDRIDALKKRHAVELRLVHVLYASWRDGPAHGVPPFEQQIDALSATDLFDSAWYLETYPDVVEGGKRPKEHYVRSGAFEGRNPGPDFDTISYYIANPDVADTGWPALVHYALFGKNEGRAIA
ncbi:LuxQ periplasmic sensor domain-containing protein [Thalassovita taeanensis]|uniref:LuxQ protein n=1 Tax=Thalassovita taeanensis TaxID=657014 RepID=A0A1H9KXV9_9RHOB|nr:LuxQ periplasmic sensor domain-containing protein [Thalassovita taeanensis]SER03839.1 LuxQ protein [Thalassovita taeanensis]